MPDFFFILKKIDKNKILFRDYKSNEIKILKTEHTQW